LAERAQAAKPADASRSLQTMIGAVLAGGGDRRRGSGSAPGALLAGRPLVSYPVAAVAGVCDRVAVVCKEHTTLPKLRGTERWNEPADPRHPLTGIVYALEMAGAPVLVCAGDMPFVTADACRTLMHAASSGPAVVATAEAVLQPTFGLYTPAALETMRAAPEDAPLTRTVESLEPVRVALPPGLVRSVETAAQLADAEALLTRR
jgi:molybdenum cofactor guanylyltransferase